MNRSILFAMMLSSTAIADDSVMDTLGKILTMTPEQIAKAVSFERLLGKGISHMTCEESLKSGPVNVGPDGHLMNNAQVWETCNTLQFLGKIVDSTMPNPNWRDNPEIDVYIKKFSDKTGTFDGMMFLDHCIDVYTPKDSSECERLTMETERNVSDYLSHRIDRFPVDVNLSNKKVNPEPYWRRHQDDYLKAHTITDPKEAQRYWDEMRRQMGM